MPRSIANEWGELFSQSRKAILAFYKQESNDPQTLARARVATSILSSFTRHEQTISAEKQTAVIIARHLAANNEEFRAYIHASLPDVHLPQMGLAALKPSQPDEKATG